MCVVIVEVADYKTCEVVSAHRFRNWKDAVIAAEGFFAHYKYSYPVYIHIWEQYSHTSLLQFVTPDTSVRF